MNRKKTAFVNLMDFIGDEKEPLVLVCMPYYNAQPYVRRATESILNQTYKNLILVIINDGDVETPPWGLLEDIKDQRLFRFDLKSNHGPYFAIEVALRSLNAAYLLIQDADDWSHPDRIRQLLLILRKNNSVYATSSQSQVTMSDSYVYNVIETRFKAVNNYEKEAFSADMTITEKFKYRLPHHGLFCTKMLKQLGGYYGGFYIFYDVLITNLMLMIGNVSHVDTSL